MGVEFVISMVDKASDKLVAIGKQFARTKNSAEDLARSFSSNVSSGVGSTIDKLGSGFSSLSSKISGMAGGLKESFSSIPGVGLLLNPIVAVTAGVTALIAGVSKLGEMSQQWELGMAKINVTAQLSKTQLQDLSSKLREVGSRVPVDLEKIPEAYNKIISAGLSVNEATAALEPTLLAAKAGFADTAVVAMAGTRIMKSTGLEITQVYDKLFATLNKGNAEFADIAQYLPRVIPAADALGASFNDIAGAFATLTTSMSAEQSATSLQNIFVALGKSNVRKNLQDIGVAVFDSSGKMRGMTDIVRDLNDQMYGLSDEAKALKLTKLGFDQESMTGFGNLSKNLKDLDSNIRFVTNSTGELQKAVDNSTTSVDKETLAWNRFKNALAPIGEGFVSIKIAFLDLITGIANGEMWKTVVAQFDVIKYAFLINASKMEVGWLSLVYKLEKSWASFKGMLGFDNKQALADANAAGYNLLNAMKEQQKNTALGQTALGAMNKKWWSGDDKNNSLIANGKQYIKSEFSPILNIPELNKTSEPFDLFNSAAKSTSIVKPFKEKSKDTETGKSSSTIASGGTRNTSISITLGKFTDNIIFQGSLDENAAKVEAKMQELFLRTLNAASASA